MSKEAAKVKAPPLKIQGIKTKLVPFIMRSVKWNGNGQWIEPFLGSGVVAFNICPDRALLADSNEHIINFYKAIQEGEINQYNLRPYLEQEGRSLRKKGEVHYYEIRERFNSHHSPFDFLFLNRSCFNGVMRFNSRGRFNVPFCRKLDRFAQAYITKICNQVAWVQQRLRGKEWIFVTQNWRKTLSQVQDGDFVYLDPPYNDRHTDYYNRWNDGEADELAESIKQLRVGFAYSTWKGNKYRNNKHLDKHFSTYPVFTEEHFYHVGSKESLRNAMEEALVVAPQSVAETVRHSLYPVTPEQPTLF
jgi:DNA adenine methylase